MSRSGYDDYCDIDTWSLIRWRGAVASAIKGKRGQSLLVEMRDALDALPEKRLAAGILVDDGDVCALGAVALARGLDVSEVDPEEADVVAELFGVSPALVREITYENDDCGSWSPEKRWAYMRRWVERQITSKENLE
jgi:hypothetical protein